MQSDNITKAKQLISRYPEVFDSLLEYEKTKRIQKLYHRIRINLTIDENVLKDFKRFCSKNNINMSRYIEARMLEGMKK
jgi:hypothetical protein